MHRVCCINLCILTAESLGIVCRWISGFRNADPGESLFEPCALLDKLIAEGKLGLKTGQGFYSYDKNKKWMLAFCVTSFSFHAVVKMFGDVTRMSSVALSICDSVLSFAEIHSQLTVWLHDIPLATYIMLLVLLLEIIEFTLIGDQCYCQGLKNRLN